MSRKSFDNDTLLAIGRRIREIRGERTQREFAELLGIDRATLANYENGRRIPNDEIIRKISDLSGKDIPEIIFGETKTPFKQYQEQINKHIAELSSKHPGYIPKWFISDDEIAFIIAYRLAKINSRTHDHSILEEIVRRADELIQTDKQMYGSIPVYGEGYINRLRAAIERGTGLEEGYDPDFTLYATFDEESPSRK